MLQVDDYSLSQKKDIHYIYYNHYCKAMRHVRWHGS